MQPCLYVLFSATPYRMGRCIRAVTREPYNHVSIATEADLRTLYSFARRYEKTPFYGGFVTETPCRYHRRGVTAAIRLYRIPLTEEKWQRLQSLLKEMDRRPERYLYNHLSALTAPLHVKIRVRDAFTCAEFVVSVLSRLELGLDFDPRKFYTISGIARRLEDYCVYTGTFPAPPEADAEFLDPQPLAHPLLSSTGNFLRLLWRVAVPGN